MITVSYVDLLLTVLTACALASTVALVLGMIRARATMARFDALLSRLEPLVPEVDRLSREAEEALRSGVSPVLPEISASDTEKISQALLRVSSALETATERGWMSGEAAGKLFAAGCCRTVISSCRRPFQKGCKETTSGEGKRLLALRDGTRCSATVSPATCTSILAAGCTWPPWCAWRISQRSCGLLVVRVRVQGRSTAATACT